jgi:hypothetical protein
MKNYQIPKKNDDLKRYAAWKNTKYMLFYLLYLAFFILAFGFYMSGRHETEGELPWWVYPVYVALVAVSGWVICCMNRFVCDQSFFGEIVSIGVKRDYDRGLSRTAGFSLEEHTYLSIVAVNGKGRKRRTRCRLFDDGYDCYYNVGDKIVKFRGLNYPLSLDSERKGAHLCAICGVRTYYQEGKAIHGEATPEIRDGSLICRSCGHTLMCINIETEIKR